MVASEERVLVTGATGFIGVHIVSLLLEKGYFVRAAVRNQKKADALAARFSTFKDKLEFAFIDLTKPETFNSVLGGITGVFHVAAILPGALKTTVEADYLIPSIEGNLALLRAASKTPSIKRIVVCSSFVTLWNASTNPNHVYSESDWNPITYEAAAAATGPHADIVGYLAGKTLAEKAAFDFVQKENPHFDIVSILPAMVFGPPESTTETVADISSLKMVLEYLTTKTEVEPAQPFAYVVDVRDVAQAHLLAYENPKASNQRYLVMGESFAWNEVVELAHTEFKGQTQAPPLTVPAAHIHSIRHLEIQE